MIEVPLKGRPATAPGGDVLVGVDGNAFSVLAETARALRKAGATAEFTNEYRAAATAGDYDHLLAVSLAFLEAGQEEAR